MKKDPHRSTTAQTDTEAGHEKLPDDQEKARSINALKVMYKSGLIKDSEYQQRLAELEASAEPKK